MMADHLDKHFRVFGLDARASFEQVKEARKWYTKAFHPDRFPKDSSDAKKAEEKQKEINSAFEALEKWFKSGEYDPPKKAPAPKSHTTSKKTWSDELGHYMDYVLVSNKSPSTKRNIISDLCLFADWLEAYGLTAELRSLNLPILLDQFEKHVSHRHYSPATKARHLYSIRSWLIFEGINAEFVLSMTAKHKSKVKPQAKALSRSDLKAFFKVVHLYAEPEDLAIVEFLSHTGLTVSELCQLRWKHVSFHELGRGQKCLMLDIAGRSGKRQIPINPEAMQVLVDRGLDDVSREAGKSQLGWIFTRNGQKLTPKMVHYVIERYSLLTDIKVTPSILRNTYARKLAQSGVPRTHLAQLLGLSLQSVAVYYHESEGTLNDLVSATSKASR